MMLTNVIDIASAIDITNVPRGRRRTSTDARTVVIANGGSQMSELLETAIDAGQYDVVFVESIAHAYSQIKKVQPDLVILSIRMDDVDGLRVLSMLKLDPDTRRIPVLTYTSDEADDSETEEADSADDELFVPHTVLRMN
jgi:PleD family two-component response regulator